jgi:hypothetical protein
LSGSSPLTCLAWEALPVAYATASLALGIMWPHKPHHYVKVGIPSGGLTAFMAIKICHGPEELLVIILNGTTKDGRDGRNMWETVNTVAIRQREHCGLCYFVNVWSVKKKYHKITDCQFSRDIDKFCKWLYGNSHVFGSSFKSGFFFPFFIFFHPERIFNGGQYTCRRLLLLNGLYMNFSWSSCLNNFTLDVTLCLWFYKSLYRYHQHNYILVCTNILLFMCTNRCNFWEMYIHSTLYLSVLYLSQPPEGIPTLR